MKKILMIFCFCLITGLLISCKTVETETSAGEDNKSQVKYTIYYSSSDAANFTNSSSSSEVEYKLANEKLFSPYKETETDKSVNAAEQLSVELNGKTYILPYDLSYKTDLATTENFEKYGKFDSYKNESDKTYAVVRSDTNELLRFRIGGKNIASTDTRITENEAKKIASSVFSSLYGSISAEYPYSFTIFTDEQYAVLYTVVYQKYVYGIPTDDTIQININMKGEVYSIRAIQLGMFSSAEDELKKEDIENAISVLNQKFSDRYTLGDVKLVVDSMGDYYIYAMPLRKASDSVKDDTQPLFEPFSVYINVK